MGKTNEYRYSLHIYDGLIVLRGHILRFDLEATRCFHGVYWHLFSPACQLCHKPLGLFLWERWHPIPVRVYNKSRYLAVHSGSVPDTSWPLFQACTGSILSMVRQSPSVFNNLLSGLYAEVCGMGYIPTYTIQMSFNNIIITCSWYLTSYTLDLYLADLWYDTLSCSPLTHNTCATLLLIFEFHTVSLFCYYKGKLRLYKLRLQWHEVWGIYMRVSLFGLFLRCTNLTDR